MNIAEVPCSDCGRVVRIVRRKFGEDPIVTLNAVPDHVAGDWFIGPKSVSHMDETEARSMRGAGFDTFTEHACSSRNGAA